MFKKSALGLAAVLLALQFIRPEKNRSAVPAATDLFVLHPAPAEVKNLLTIGCYDCHSDNTRYPWYAEIQPVGWWLAKHVADGKNELNLSAFGRLSTKRTTKKLDDMINLITSRKMPLASYTLVHRDARFTDAQIKQLTNWLEDLIDQVAPGK